MLVSEGVLKWTMRFYPPLFFQRIWIKNIDKGFMGASLTIYRSILNSNFNRSIFGGSIFCAADAVYPILLYQNLIRRGHKPLIWLKRSEIDYIKPGMSNLHLSVRISEAEIQEICDELESSGKFTRNYPLEIFDKEERLCVVVKNEVYIRTIRST